MSNADASPPDLPALATSLLRGARAGVLSTTSVHHAGYPFGSLTPFALARDGALVLVLSDLAEHTKNLRADPRASLFVHDPAAQGDPQAGARITVLGRVALLEGDALADARARYVARFADADDYLRKLDFRVYALAPEHVRLIGGFGRIAWLPASSVRSDPSRDPLADAASDILAHMNGDHADVLGLYVAAFRAREGVRPTMTGVDAWGFDLQDPASGERFRFDFGAPATTPDAVRREVVALAKAAREALGLPQRLGNRG